MLDARYVIKDVINGKLYAFQSWDELVDFVNGKTKGFF